MTKLLQASEMWALGKWLQKTCYWLGGIQGYDRVL